MSDWINDNDMNNERETELEKQRKRDALIDEALGVDSAENIDISQNVISSDVQNETVSSPVPAPDVWPPFTSPPSLNDSPPPEVPSTAIPPMPEPVAVPQDSQPGYNNREYTSGVSTYNREYTNQAGGWQNYNTPSTPTPPPPPNHPKKNGPMVAVIVLSVICAFSILAVGAMFVFTLNTSTTTDPSSITSNNSNKNSTEPTTQATSNDNAPTLEITPDPDNAVGISTRDIIKMNLDSTVVINSYSKRSNLYPGMSENSEPVQTGTASGIVWKADGYIITNCHVVVNETTGEKYDRIDVVMYDKTVYKDAIIVGTDSATDLAVIKIDGVNNLTPAVFGSSSELQLGDTIVALGNSGGLEWSATRGIVSGLARDVYQNMNFAIKCLQIDAPINPGNSGGPLLSAYGKVVGINSSKVAQTGYEGLGFSIPIDDAVPVLNDLAQYGYVRNRVALGITGEFITQPFEAFQIKAIDNESCLVGTNARVDDYITYVNGQRISSYAILRSEISKCSVGDEVELKLVRIDRAGRAENITVTCTLKELKGN